MLKNKKFLKIMCMVIVIASVSIVLGNIPSYAALNTSLSSMSVGDIVSFGGKQWVIVDPSTGLIVLNSNDGNRKWDAGNSNTYSSSDIRTYLNGTFLNSIPTDDRDLIQDYTWNVGGHSNESGSTVTDKVGLLTKSEYEAVRGSAFPSGGQGYVWWLITPASSNSNHVWYVSSDGDVSRHNADNSFGVRPALHLKSGLYVSGGQITEDPGTVTTTEIQDGTILLADLSEEVKNGIGNTAITVVKDQAFNVVMAGHDNVTNGASASGVTVENVDGADGFIKLSGTFNSSGIQKVTIEGSVFIFNVIEAPSAATVTATFN